MSTMPSPLVSLIMPSYNYAGFLSMAIESALAQTHSHIELIICDDASQDDSFDVAQSWAQRDPRIIVMRNPVNLGIAQTRRRLLDQCRGTYVGHLDCDDLLERWAVEEMLKAFASDPLIALVYSDSAIIDAAGKVTSYRLEPDYSYRNLAYLGWRHFGMYKRELALMYGGYNPHVSGCEDGDLFMKIASRHVCHRLAKVLYFHRSHSSNSSASNRKCDTCDVKSQCDYHAIWSKVVAEFYPAQTTDNSQSS